MSCLNWANKGVQRKVDEIFDWDRVIEKIKNNNYLLFATQRLAVDATS